MTPPLRWLYRNILFGAGDTRAALYRLNTISYPYLPETDKEALFWKLVNFCHQVEADFSLWRVARAFPASRYRSDVEHMFDARHGDREGWDKYTTGHEAHLVGRRDFTPEVYVAIRFREEKGKLERKGIKVKRTRPAMFTALDDAEDSIYQMLTHNLEAERATTREVQWLLQRAPCRGLEEPELDDWWAPPALSIEGGVYKPKGREFIRLTNNPVYQRRRYVEAESEHGISYQTALVFGSMPNHIKFPGSGELLFGPLEDMPFPVDAVVHVHWRSNEEMLEEAKKRVVDADVAVKDQEGVSVGWQAEEDQVWALEAEKFFRRDDRPPGLDLAVSLIYGAPTEKDLERRTARLKQRYGGQPHLHRPFAIQGALYADHMPRPDGGTKLRDAYGELFIPQQFAALMPVATHHAGSERGLYAGTMGQRPFKFDITEAALKNRPPSILIFGTPGGGKTFWAQLLCLQAALRGSKVVDIDPKPPMGDHHLEDLPELAGKVQVIRLSGDEEFRGLLDPIVISPVGEAEDIASSYYMELLPQGLPSWSTHIRRAVRQVLSEHDPSSLRVLDKLLHSPHEEAKAVGEALEIWADTNVGRLAFGSGDKVDIPTSLVTSIKTPGLVLPKAGMAPMNDRERLGSATMKLVAAFAMNLVSGDRTRHKVVNVGEAHTILSSDEGRVVVDSLNRMGRFQNAVVILDTQHLEDTGKIEALVGTRFVFRQEQPEEAQQGLRILGLNPNDTSLVQKIRHFEQGECLFRDIHDRIARVQIDPVYPHLLDILSTTPEHHSQTIPVPA